MTFAGWFTIIAFVVVVTALAFPLGSYMAKVYTGERVIFSPVFSGPERFLYRILRVDEERQQDWKAYAKSLIIFSLAGWIFLYIILRTHIARLRAKIEPEGGAGPRYIVTDPGVGYRFSE